MRKSLWACYSNLAQILRRLSSIWMRRSWRYSLKCFAWAFLANDILDLPNLAEFAIKCYVSVYLPYLHWIEIFTMAPVT